MKQRQSAREAVVAIQGEVVTAPEFYHRLETFGGAAVLQKIVDEKRLLQYARQHHVYPSEAQVAARFRQQRTRPDFDQYLRATQQTTDDITNKIRVDLAEENLFGENVTVSDAEVQAYYRRETNPANPAARFYTPEAITVLVISTPTEALAREALHDLQKGTPFDAAAKRYSRDSSAPNGGSGPPILRGRSPIKQFIGFEDAIFALQAGEQMGPRQFAGAWWIVRCREKTAASVIPFNKVEKDCRDAVRLLKGVASHSAELRSDYEKYRRKAQMQVFWDRYLYSLKGPEKISAATP